MQPARKARERNGTVTMLIDLQGTRHKVRSTIALAAGTDRRCKAS